MAELDVVDVTLRDAHQSLWATRMPTSMMLPIARRMDTVGFKVIDLMAAVTFDVCVRYLREDPWQRIRLIRREVERTPLGGWVRSRSLVSFNLVSDDVVALWVRALAKNGIRRLTFFDALFDIDNLAFSIRTAQSLGVDTVGALVYSLSPAHTDGLYAAKTAELVALGVSAVLLKDSAGLLTPERVATLLPAMQRELHGTPLEIHSHCTTGLAPMVYDEAIKRGVDAVHTAISPLAHGPSLPPTERTVEYARRAGRPAALEPGGLEAMAAHFRESARAAGLPLGEPVEHDPFHYEHQVPGGMMTNLKAQLRQIGLETRLGEILVEIARVREELGYLNMVTPTSQLVGTQAVINVVRGERYAVVPEEVVKYALGWYGKPVAPLDPDVLDRILATPAAKRFARREPLAPVIPEIRRRFGSHLSDEEVLLRIIFPEEHVRALLAAPPLEATAGGTCPDLLNLVRAVLGRGRAGSVRIQGDGVAVSARFA